MEKKNLK